MSSTSKTQVSQKDLLEKTTCQNLLEGDEETLDFYSEQIKATFAAMQAKVHGGTENIPKTAQGKTVEQVIDAEGPNGLEWSLATMLTWDNGTYVMKLPPLFGNLAEPLGKGKDAQKFADAVLRRFKVRQARRGGSDLLRVHT